MRRRKLTCPAYRRRQSRRSSSALNFSGAFAANSAQNYGDKGGVKGSGYKRCTAASDPQSPRHKSNPGTTPAPLTLRSLLGCAMGAATGADFQM